MATHYRTCPFCEATCGLEVETEGREVVSVRGDAEDVFSRGFICPKAFGLKQLHEDPDRLTTPLVRRDGELVEATWDEAFEEIDRRLSPIIAEHGKHAVAVYLGNPNAHNLSAITHGPAWLRVLGTQNLYSASTVDQMPKQVSAGHMFGTMLSVPIPDVDRCDHYLLLGANPLVSNGSLLTAPNMRGRLRSIRERGGKVVVVDPRRTRTADEADEHHFIRPGTDPLVSTPNSGRLERAVEGLDFMLSIDIYVNETTRHADVILPAPEPLEKSHYDAAFYQLSTRNIANYSPAVLQRPAPAP